MKMIKLERQSRPKFDKLYEMIRDLKDFLDVEANFDDEEWKRNMDAILDFQDDDGSFKLLDSYRIPGDARVDFCYIPTYLCCAILMKAFLTDCGAFTSREKSALKNGLDASCVRNLRGHGYEAFKGQIEALNIFIEGGLREFLDLYPDFCLQFRDMISRIIYDFKFRQSQGKFLGPWGESYEDEIRKINLYFCERTVFVYGTLMTGETNHSYLEGSDFLGRTIIEGYEMYNVGWYPAIISGDGIIIGEAYRVPKEDIGSIDALECEGSLYAKRCERLSVNGNATFAFVYVYLRGCSGFERIPAWKDYVWYVSYGSNMLEDRFLCYIRGGSFEGSRPRSPCSDTTLPLAVKTVDIPYDMYFGNHSGSWHDGGVSFLDTSTEGHSLGVAYLITKEQFDHVASEENGGRYPGGGQWYENIIDLDPIDGIEVKTITNNDLRQYNEPCFEYLETLRKGIRQNWPEMTEEEIEEYLNDCIRG